MQKIKIFRGIFLLTCFIVVIIPLNSQTLSFSWAKHFGGTNIETGKAIAVDSNGNVFTTGWFQGTVDFDPGSGVTNFTAASADADFFISKLDPSGNLVWVKQIGGMNIDRGEAIQIDASGNVIIAGSFGLLVDFDPGPGVVNLTAGTISDVFILKLDNSGNFIWVKQMGGDGDNECTSLFVDPSGNICTTGYFYGTTDFDPGAGTFSIASVFNENDIFISKLDQNGNFIWAKDFT